MNKQRSNLVHENVWITVWTKQSTLDGDTAGWSVEDNLPSGAEVINVSGGRSPGGRAILTKGTGLENRIRFVPSRGITEKFIASYPVVRWDMNYRNGSVIRIGVMTDSGAKELAYSPMFSAVTQIENTVQFPIPLSYPTDWNQVARNVQADMASVLGAVTIEYIEYFDIQGVGWVDSIILMRP